MPKKISKGKNKPINFRKFVGNLSLMALFPSSRKLRKSFEYSKKLLSYIPRKKVETYFHHGLRISAKLSEVSDNSSLHSISILHDILSHPKGEELLEKSPLSKSEKIIVKKLHNLRNLSIDSNYRDLNKAISSFSSDYRILLLRMAHRFVDIHDLDKFSKKRGEKIARETLHMYVPLADRLGIYKWRYEMEDICFAYLHPDTVKNLKFKFSEYRRNDLICLKMTKDFLSKEIRKIGIKFRMENRIKSIYSTYRKMIFKKKKFEELSDRLAIRIIVNTKDECYRILGAVHGCMHLVPGKLKDYIGFAKENLYQSIHTVVYPLPGITDRTIEIQIRTEEMHKKCEFGIASHLYYKKNNYNLRYEPKTKAYLIKNLDILKREAHSAEEFGKILQNYFAGNKILVFDEKDKSYHIKRFSTALNFVNIFNEKKHPLIKSVKINGLVSDLNTVLKDGDVIEVTFKKVNNNLRS